MGEVFAGLMCGDVPALEDVVERPAWHLDAACREHPELDFFPTRGQPLDAVREVCAGCLVRAECLADALPHFDRAGIWGGLSERERKRLRRTRRSA